MIETDTEQKGLRTKIDDLQNVLSDLSSEPCILTEKKASLINPFNLKLYEEKKSTITEFLNKEKREAYDDMENFKNNMLKKISIINEKNEDIKKQLDILMAERNKNLCFIKNLETKLGNIKKIIM
ncbi:hypothetical protein PGO_126380 [Plasmodium gonderi]|uniref:Uncharacterized protein n=1 Tax=Plasmodium gonderi TaxID=77519 RepID=A0A1Y1JK41_PLAGO|nr:hypothetical protein PGO_126380 [Plasmodium gonderi]GAW82640.1 hypothetical protein PGO_126380 [Plasmodium gonderi]